MFKKLKKSDVRFLVALLAAHLIFFLLAVYCKKIFNGDSAEYIYEAVNIKNRFWFYSGNPVLPVVKEYLTLRTPVYPLFIALIYCISVNNWLVLVAQNAISIWNIYYLRQTIRRLGYSRKYDWLLMAFTILYPSQFVNANIIAPDILLQTCVLFYFSQFVCMVQKKQWRYAFGMSAALCVGMMVKPVLYPFCFIHCVIILVLTVYMRKGLFRPFAAAVLPLCLLMLYGVWNYNRTGKLHFSSTQSFNAIFYYYTYLSHLEGRAQGDVFLQQERAKLAAIPDFAMRYDYANARGMDLLKTHFAGYMYYHTAKSAGMIIAPGKGELDMFLGNLTLGMLYNTEQPMGLLDIIRTRGMNGFRSYVYHNPSFPIAIMVLFFNCIRLIGVMIFLFSRSVNIYIRLFVALLLFYFCFTAGVIATTRYFIPVSLIAIGGATIVFQKILLNLKARSASYQPII